MDALSAFNSDLAPDLVNHLLTEQNLPPLNTVEEAIVLGCCAGNTYAAIAKHLGYTEGHVADIASKLWKRLTTTALDSPVKKSNVAAALRRYWESQRTNPSDESIPHPDDGPLPVGSRFFIKRRDVGDQYYQEVVRPGGLIHIKGAKSMGKTSWIRHVLSCIPPVSVCYLDIKSIEGSVFGDLDTFLKWLCMFVSQSLSIESVFETIWDSDLLTPVGNCSDYFEQLILPNTTDGLVLVLDGIDQLFEHENWVGDVLSMLRNWHERAKTSHLWKNLRLILSHSTEVYITLDPDLSPFHNVGLPVRLMPLSLTEIQELVSQYQLSLNAHELKYLPDVTGGHPYLTQLALYTSKLHHKPVKTILETAADESGCYISYLRRLLTILKRSPDLVDAYRNVVRSHHPIALDTFHIYQLQGLGLITLEKNNAQPSCQLYRDYFGRVL